MQLGGTSAMSSGLLYLGGGTATQKACGVVDTADAMYDFLLLACGPGVDPAKARLYCDESVDHHDWLVDHGVEFKPELFPEPDIQPATDAGLGFTGGEDTWPFAAPHATRAPWSPRPVPQRVGRVPHGAARRGGHRRRCRGRLRGARRAPGRGRVRRRGGHRGHAQRSALARAAPQEA